MEVCVRAGRAVLRSHVNLWVKVFRHGGVALLARGFLGVERHFGTFNDDIVDFVLFPPTRKHNTNNQKRIVSHFDHLMCENMCYVDGKIHLATSRLHYNSLTKLNSMPINWNCVDSCLLVVGHHSYLVGSSSWSLVPVTSSGWIRTCSSIGWKRRLEVIWHDNQWKSMNSPV